MKANEAPEKVYFSEIENGTHYYTEGIPFEREYIEYIRTDTLIEKVCEFIRKGGNRGDAYIVTEFGEEVFNFVQFAEDFKNYMKGE